MLHVERSARGPVIIVDPRGHVPAVAIYVWVRAGASWESRAQAGAAHFMEHMLFKGAGAFGVGEIPARFEGMGGELNAFTSYEETVLHAVVPAGEESAAIALLATMALHPRLDPGELERERGVVLEEIRGAQDDPSALLADALRRASWGDDHPLGHAILGDEQTVSGLTLETLRAHYEAGFRPDNIIVSVAGPVDVERVVAQVQDAFGEAPSAPLRRPQLTRPQLPVRSGAFVIDKDFEDRVFELAFAVPGHGHPDIPALDLLATGLGEGASGLLPAELRLERGVALDAWAVLESEPLGGALAVGLAAREGRSREGLGALVDVLERVRDEGLSRPALRRARAAVRADRLGARETVEGRAFRHAWYQAFFDDPAGERAYETALAAVTPADIARVARRYLDLGRCVAGAVVPPRELDRRGLESALAGHPSRVAPVHRGLTRARLSSGVTVVIEPDPEAELLAMSVVGVGGTLVEGRRGAGLAGAWSSAVDSGAGALNAVGMAAAVEERAGSLRSWAGRNSNGVVGVFPADELRAGVSLLGMVLSAPRFDPKEVERVRDDLMEGRRAMEDDPASWAWELAWRALVPGHPWGRPTLGTPASVRDLSPRRLRAYHERVVQGANLVVGVSGAVDPAEIVELLEGALGGLPVGAPVSPAPPVFAPAFVRQRRRTVQRESAPASLVLGFPGVGHGSSDEPTLAILAAVLGGAAGGTGRLFDELRERRGLAYDVGFSADRGLGGGALFCSLLTDAQRAPEAWSALERVLYDVVENGITESELTRVKAGVVDGAVLGLQRVSARADHLAAAERYGPGAEHVRAVLEAPRGVRAEQVQALAARLLRLDRCVRVQVGPPAG